MKIIDVHTHAFPDPVAVKAVPTLEGKSGVKARGEGTIASLLASMASSGISASVVGSIATKPEQSAKITAWSVDVQKNLPSIIPLGSIHPAGDWKTDLDAVKKAGLTGIKLHPYYQDFIVDDDRMLKIYGYSQKLGLFILFHAGFDIGYEHYDCASPKRFYNVWKSLPGLKAILAHMGGWLVWDEVLEHLPGTGYYLDTSYCDGFIAPGQLSSLLKIWPKDRLCFGTDFPWTGQKEAAGLVEKWGLSPEEREGVFGSNFVRFLGEAGSVETAKRLSLS